MQKSLSLSARKNFSKNNKKQEPASLCGGLNLNGANLRYTDLSGAVFSGANLSGARFSRPNLSKVRLSNAGLERIERLSVSIV